MDSKAIIPRGGGGSRPIPTIPEREDSSGGMVVSSSSAGAHSPMEWHLKTERENRKTLELVNDILFLCVLDMWSWMTTTMNANNAAGVYNPSDSPFLAQTRDRLILVSEHLTHARTFLTRHKQPGGPAGGGGHSGGTVSTVASPPYINYYASLYAVLQQTGNTNNASPNKRMIPAPQHMHGGGGGGGSDKMHLSANMLAGFSSRSASPIPPVPSNARHHSAGSVSALIRPPTSEKVSLPPLDYTKIRMALRTLSLLPKAILVQALRWRLNRSPQQQRQHIIHQFIEADFLQCKLAADKHAAGLGGSPIKQPPNNNAVDDKESGSVSKPSKASAFGTGEVNIESGYLLDALLRPSTATPVTGSGNSSGASAEITLLREATTRLINSLASYALGRSYLLLHPRLLGLLYDILQAEPASDDTFIRQNALGALQKFSLRRYPQSAMIQIGVVEWVVNRLLLPTVTTNTAASTASASTATAADSKAASLTSSTPTPVLSEYSREYGTALLMNLCLRTAGKVRCQKVLQNLMTVVISMLESPSTQVRTYINGTLYSVLSRKAIREYCRSLKINERLSAIQSKSEEHFQRQIDHILQQLNCDEVGGASSSPPPIEKDVSDDEGGSASSAASSAGSTAGDSSGAEERNEQADEDGGRDESDDNEDEEEDEFNRAAFVLASIKGQARGEALLCSSYLAEHTNAEAQIQKSTLAISQRVGGSSVIPSAVPLAASSPSNAPVLRPITPGGKASASNAAIAAANAASGGSSAAPPTLNTGATAPEELSAFMPKRQFPRTPHHLNRQSSASSSNNSSSHTLLGFAPGAAAAATGSTYQPPTQPPPNPTSPTRASAVTAAAASPASSPDKGGSRPPLAPSQSQQQKEKAAASSAGGSPPTAFHQIQIQHATSVSSPGGGSSTHPAVFDHRELPPPKSVETPESLEQYYSAFAPRSKIGRTPITSSFATTGEWGGVINPNK